MKGRSARHYVTLAEELCASLASPRRAIALSNFEHLRHDLHAALGHFLALGDVQHTVRLALALRDCWWESGHLGEGRQWLDRILEAPQLPMEPKVRATVLDLTGALAYAEGDPQTARRHMEESLAIRKTLGDPAQTAQSLNHLAGVLKWGLRDRAAARPLMEESLREAQRADNHYLIGAALLGLGTLAIDLGNYSEAESYLSEALVVVDQEHRLIPFALEDFAALAAAQGQPHRALQLGGAAEGLHERLATFRAHNLIAWLDLYLKPAKEGLPSRVVSDLWSRGREMTMEQATSYALHAADHRHC